MSSAPRVDFVLPGVWRKAELDDPVAVRALTDLLPDASRGAAAWLDSIREAGAQTLLLNIGSTPSSAIVFIWPPAETRGDPSVDALRTRVGIVGDVLAHAGGYAMVRHREVHENPPQDAVTYAVAHPDTGRVLIVRCMAFDGVLEDFKVEDFDLAAGDLTWEES